MAKNTIPSKRKKFVHKEVIFTKEVGKPFEKLLREALKAHTAVDSRMQDGSNEGEKRFINYHLMHDSESGPIFGCEFLGYETGSDHSIIKLKTKATQLDVDSLPAGPDREFVGGSVYFGVKGNQVILFQSMSLRTLELESYLNWLLRIATKQIEEDVCLSLIDHISKKKRNQIKGVTGIKLKTPFFGDQNIKPAKGGNDAKEGEEARSESMFIVPKGNPWEALKKFFGDTIDLPKKLNGASLTELTDLEIQLYLRWKGKHKDDENVFLDSIANQMRHIDDEIDYDIETKSGSVSRDKLKNEKEFSVKWTDRGRPVMEALFPQMAEWLAYLVKHGNVDP